MFTFYSLNLRDLDTDRSLEGYPQLAVKLIMILEYLLCQKVIKNPKIDGDVSKSTDDLTMFPPAQIWDKLNTK